MPIEYHKFYTPSPIGSTYEQIGPRPITLLGNFDFSEENLPRAYHDPNLTPTSIREVVEDFLTMAGEGWPKGFGFIGANYDPQSNELTDLFLGRLIDLQDGRIMIFGVGTSKKSNRSLFYKVEASDPSLLSLLPKERQSDRMLSIPEDILLPYAPPFVNPTQI